MKRSTLSFDLDYRPRTYFWPLGLKPHPLSSVKGANRRRLVAGVLADDPDADIPPVLLQSALPEPLRQYLGSLHPSGMGGEYLPDLATQEVEIARITIASTTQDVTCVFARKVGRGILLRVVDEYDGGTLTDSTTRSVRQPLSLRQLVHFFLGGWDLCAVIQMNFESDNYPEDPVLGFFLGTSDFYPEFDLLLRRRVGTFLRAQRI